MSTIKSYTDIEQSKKLAEILPIESADGFWEYHDKWCSEGDEWEGYEDYPRAEPYLEYTRKENEWKEDKSDVPCWSLAALLELLGDGNWKIHCTKGLENPITITYKFWDTVIVKHGKDLIDVAVDLICEVYKQDLA